MKKLDQACPIWGTVADVYEDTRPEWIVESARAGGRYRIDLDEIDRLRRAPPAQKAIVTTWLVDRHRLGDAEPLLNEEAVDRALLARPLAFSEQRRRFFLLLSHLGFRASSKIQMSGLVTPQWTTSKEKMAAWIEAHEDGEVAAFLRILVQDGFLSLPTGDWAHLSAKGLQHLEEVQTGGAPTDQAFVAMWFDPSMEDAYIHGFELGTRAAGYRALRIDRKEHANKIDDEIIAEIRRSRFVIADFTAGLVGNGSAQAVVPRGGVYYEAGFAQGLGTPVIWTVREDCIAHVHFDTRQFAHIVWSTPEELATKLRNRIVAVIGEGPNPNSRE